MELFLFLLPAKFWGLWGHSPMALFFITYVMIINCLESSSSAIRTKTGSNYITTPALRLIDPESSWLNWKTGLVFFLRVTLLLSLLQEFWRPRAPRTPLYLLAATHQNRPPPPSSSSQWSSRCTGPQGPGTTSSPWEDQATWLPARPMAAGPSGASQRLQRRTLFCLCLFLLTLTKTLPFLLTAGQPCWTVKPRAQETTASPCWRALLHSHSQMKVCSHSVRPPQKCNAGSNDSDEEKKQPISLTGTLTIRRKRPAWFCPAETKSN